MATSVSILNLVGNFARGGIGYGHTAIIVDQTVWSFEKITGSGWIQRDVESYVRLNRSRPVVRQDLFRSQVDPQKVHNYLKASNESGDGYGTSGVCSSQVSNAIDAGTTTEFNPFGIDEPVEVFHSARRAGIVKKVTVIAPKKWTPASTTKLRAHYRLDRDGSAWSGYLRNLTRR